MGLHTHGRADAAGWYTRYFSQLVGATITGFSMTSDPPDPEFPEHSLDELWPTFTAKLADGREVTLLHQKRVTDNLAEYVSGNADCLVVGEGFCLTCGSRTS